ncbi:ABC transporter permease [Nocardioides sp. JQ2195]|uniref:ABC transporter permease n=1 Tax=Nocardioides sp. JQ2195 TaxID=2592334 RepID=UPI00143EDDEB|nr:ABC transporter permease [Nocardioides sp. JQ2195]QIX27296.1 ABC transporter permease [Nocardioides sp. JQ2195]
MRAVTGAAVLVRTFLARDLLTIACWTAGVTLLYWSQAISVDGLYSSQAEFDRAAASMEQNAAFVAMAGPARALNTTGGQVAWQATAFGAVLVGLMSMFLVGRHTRVEEETGRDELVRSAAIGRHAPMTAALAVTLLANAVVGLVTSASLLGYGLPAAGSWAIGVGLFLVGACFTGVALVAAQLTQGARAMYGIVGAVLGAAYALRAIGDVAGNGLSWLSPIGWYQAMRPYADERWWPASVLLVAAAVTVGAAYAVFGRRDVGSGVWASRPGPARASGGLAGWGVPGALGLAWRLHRGSLIGWTVGLFLGGLGYGTIGDDIGDLIGDSEATREVLAAGAADLVDGFYGAAGLMLALIAGGYAVSAALRARGEEDAGRIEALLSTGLSRTGWILAHILVTVAGSVVVVIASGAGLGAGYGLVTGKWDQFARLAVAPASAGAGVLVLIGLGVVLVGLVPRWAGLAWLALGFCAVVMMFGQLLEFPDWLVDLSPFSHLALVPAQPFEAGSYAGVLAVGALLLLVGVLGLRRRDLR